MSADPLELERIRDRLARVTALHDNAVPRPSSVPRIGEHEWRGLAYGIYSARVDALAESFHAAERDLADAVTTARAELLDALG